MTKNFPTDVFLRNLSDFCDRNNFDKGHDMDHFLAVFNHAKKAIWSEDDELENEKEKMIDDTIELDKKDKIKNPHKKANQ